MQIQNSPSVRLVVESTCHICRIYIFLCIPLNALSCEFSPQNDILGLFHKLDILYSFLFRYVNIFYDLAAVVCCPT